MAAPAPSLGTQEGPYSALSVPAMSWRIEMRAALETRWWRQRRRPVSGRSDALVRFHQKVLDNPLRSEYPPPALEECIVQLDKRLNKNRPDDRTQADPRVVIGVGNIGVAIATAYSPASSGPAFACPGAAETWRGIHGGIPL